MKTTKMFGMMLLLLAFVSCTTLNYQVYEVNSSNLIQKDNSMVFENEDCKVRYNLWAHNGSMSFVFENKTDKDIFIDMSQSFFIKNGEAFNFYLNRTFETRTFDAINIGYNYTVSSSLSVLDNRSWWPNQYAVSSSHGYMANLKKGFSSGITIKEPENICIPAKSYKVVEGYRIRPVFRKTCDKKLDYPNSVSVLANYSESNSPLKFANRIAYSFEEGNKSLKFIENSFWLESVKNYSNKEAVEKIKKDVCKKEFAPKVKVFKIGGPNLFYVTYEKEM